MAAKAHEISLEAGSKMAAAMKDVVNAAAGLSGFVIESARDLVQFMVRRGQMTQDEADKLLRQVEEHQPKRKAPPPAPAKTPSRAYADSHQASLMSHSTSPKKPAPAKPAPAKKAPAAKKPAPVAKKPAAKKAPAKKAPAKKPAKPAAKKAAAKKPAKKAPAKKPAQRK
jgi:Mn-containing catalase